VSLSSGYPSSGLLEHQADTAISIEDVISVPPIAPSHQTAKSYRLRDSNMAAAG
jgi:hypothetical protein